MSKTRSDLTRRTDERWARSWSSIYRARARRVYGIAVLFLALGALLEATGAIGKFLSAQNMLNIVDAAALVGIVAVGMAFVTYSGNYADMSVPTTMGFTGYICIELLRYGFVVAIIGSLAVGLVIGAPERLRGRQVQGQPHHLDPRGELHDDGRHPPGVGQQADLSGHGRAPSSTPLALFDGIYRLRFFNLIGLPLVILLVLVVVGQFVLTRTSFGVKLKITALPRGPPSSPASPWSAPSAISFVLAAFTATDRGPGGDVAGAGRRLVQRRRLRLQGGHRHRHRRHDARRGARAPSSASSADRSSSAF